MKEQNNKQHVQVPHLTEKDAEITPKDLLVYACIRRHMNKDTNEAFPSLETISKESGASIPTVSKCIKKLETHDYFKVFKRQGKKFNTYKINLDKCKNFEVFSYDFLDKSDLSFAEKAYILASQQFMFKSNGMGKISLTDEDLSEYIHTSRRSIARYNNSLVKKDYVTIIPNEQTHVPTKVFDFEKLGQAIVFKLKEHEDRLSDVEFNQKTLLKENQELRDDIAMLKRKIEELTKEQKETIIL